MSSNARTEHSAYIGFQVATPDVHTVTGYCAAELAINEANASQSLPVHVELVPIVGHKDPNAARAAAGSFASRPEAVGVLGPLNSDMALATQETYRSAGLVQLTSEASSPLLTNNGYDNFFRLVANDEIQGRSLGQVASRYLGADRIAVLHDGSGWGRPIAEIFSAEAERLGSQPVLVRGFGEQERRLDFEDMVRETLDAKPDLVYFAVYWNKAHIIAHKLRYGGSQAVFLGSDALKPFAFLEVPSLDATKPYHSLAGIDMRLKPSARPFMEKFALAYPLMMDAPQYAAEAYDCASLLLEAVRRAGTADRSRVLEEFRGLKGFAGAIGQIEFDEHGDLIGPEIGLYRCEDGLRQYIGAVRDLVS